MNTLQCDFTISEVKKVNPLFSSCNVRVLYTGVNRNGSSISQEVVEKAIDTIYNIPIVGEFIENKDDFGGHGGKIEISDDGINFIKTTVPYGIVPESANVYWDDVEEDNGVVHRYLNIEGALLWTSRYPEALKAIEEGRPQSMEIEVNDGSYNNNEIYEITDMVFSALCILGEDVEPCFESANISTYSLNKDKFKNEFRQMLDELKFSLLKEDFGLEGGKEMEETKEELVLEEKQFDAEAPEEDEGDEVEVTVEVEDDDDSQDEDQEDVAEDNQEEMAKKPDSEPDGDEDGKDTDDDGDGKFELLETELASLKEKYSLLEEEVVGLREFKAQKLHEEKAEKVNALFESVASELTEEELAPFKEKAFEMEVEDLKKEIFALIGQKEFEKKSKFSVNANKQMTMGIELNGETKIEASYASIIKKYNNK